MYSFFSLILNNATNESSRYFPFHSIPTCYTTQHRFRRGEERTDTTRDGKMKNMVRVYLYVHIHTAMWCGVVYAAVFECSPILSYPILLHTHYSKYSPSSLAGIESHHITWSLMSLLTNVCSLLHASRQLQVNIFLWLFLPSLATLRYARISLYSIPWHAHESRATVYCCLFQTYLLSYNKLIHATIWHHIHSFLLLPILLLSSCLASIILWFACSNISFNLALSLNVSSSLWYFCFPNPSHIPTIMCYSYS